MYIRLGKAKLSYEPRTIDDFMTIAQVVSASMSFERPALVGTKTQLTALFGESFPEKAFLEELIDWGAVLYLYRPVSTKDDHNQEGYIDLEKCNTPSYYLEEPPTVPQEMTIYKIKDLEGSLLTDEGEPYDNYIYYDGELVLVNQLPQIVGGFRTDSLNNRDTLTLYKNQSKIPYLNPMFKKDYTILLNQVNRTNLLDSLSTINSEDMVDLMAKIKKGYKTLAFKIESEPIGPLPDNSYIVIQTNTKDRVLMYAGEEVPNIPTRYYTKTESVTSWDDILNKLRRYGYFTIPDKPDMLYASFPVHTDYFYTIPDLSLVPSYQGTHDLLSEIMEDSDICMNLWSKTIGTGGIDGDITVAIEQLEDDLLYRITVSRFDYSEVFEGYIDEREGYERLDRQIEYTSILLHADFIQGDTLPVGTWTLCGATKEDYTQSMYLKSLDVFRDEMETIFPDFLLIPDIHVYGDATKADTDYYSVYLDLLDFAKETGIQILVQNNQFGDNKIEDYLYNYTGDKENRLIYFYHGMTINGWEEPGYYVFLRGLFGDSYSLSTNLVFYDSPMGDKNPYTETLDKLENKKSNYLVDNNQVYYYSQLLSGKKPETTIWMRFVLGKIRRELEKNRWSYLSERMIGTVKNRIDGILSRVQTSFSIIRRTQVSEFEIDYSNYKINLSIETWISDLVNNHMKLDITINYKNYNNS